MKKKTEPKVEKSPLQRSIESRERAIARMEQRKVELQRNTDDECGRIDKRIAQSRMLLDAIKRGDLKP